LPTDVRVKEDEGALGKKSQPTVFKGTINGQEETTMLKTTITGELADLEVRFIRQGFQWELLHVHCMKDHERSEFSRGKGMNFEELYEVREGRLLRCKTCNREWDLSLSRSGKRIEITQRYPDSNPKPVWITGTPDGKFRTMSDEETIAWFETTPLAKAGVIPPFIADAKQRLEKAKPTAESGQDTPQEKDPT